MGYDSFVPNASESLNIANNTSGVAGYPNQTSLILPFWLMRL
jgi:hypothetical protein